MSSSNYYKAPPRKTDDLTYENWKKEVSIWQFQTNVETNKQGGALFLSLEGKPRQTVLAEVTVADINSEQSVSNIFKALDRFYKKDETKSAYSAFDDFIKYRRDTKLPLKDFLIEFNLKYHKIENFNMKLPTGVLAYLLLTCANISEDKMEICRATCTELTYDKMKETIEKVGVGTTCNAVIKDTIKFSSAVHGAPSSSTVPDLSGLHFQVKQEPAFLTENAEMANSHNKGLYERYESDEEVLYGYNNGNRKFSNNSTSRTKHRSSGNFSKKKTLEKALVIFLLMLQIDLVTQGYASIVTHCVILLLTVQIVLNI